jgi:hypothetical protein
MKVDPREVQSSRAASQLGGATFPDNSAAASFAANSLYSDFALKQNDQGDPNAGCRKSNKKYSPSM